MTRNKQIVHRVFFPLLICLLTCVVLWMKYNSKPSGTATNVYMDISTIQRTMDSHVCDSYKPEKRFLAVLLVTSYVSNWELRMTHRDTMPQEVLADMGIQRLFLLGQIPPIDLSINQSHLQLEQDKFGDLLQGSFVDTYRNLSYKYVMGFKYAIERCDNVLYIVKADDDIVQDIYQVYNYLNFLDATTDVARSSNLLGGVVSYGPPERNKLSPWYVSFDEYPENSYPEYLFGWLFITNPRTAQYLLDEIENVPFFWIPDVWFTGIIRKKLNLPLIAIPN